jgi:hypothetical protein
MFILVTVFMPRGIVGLPAQLRAAAKKISHRLNHKNSGPEQVMTVSGEEIQPAKSE